MMSALKLPLPAHDDPPAPDHLSGRSKAVWARTVRDYAMRDDMSGLHVLARTLEAEDQAEAARAIIARDGDYIPRRSPDHDRPGGVPHPMIRVMLAANRLAQQGWKQLGLVPPGQPTPRRPGRPATAQAIYSRERH
jgi:hypothetical protein